MYVLVDNSQYKRNKRGTKDNVIREIVYGNFTPKKLDATKRVKKG